MTHPKQVNNSAPVLSICVPTYNRATSLRNLLQCLDVIKQRFGSAIEICLSNNSSNDNTVAVIGEFQSSLNLKVIHQESNIGGTLNMIAVAQLISGRWGMFVGDDDELVPDTIGRLLDFLNAQSSCSWILAGAAIVDGKEQYLNQFSQDSYTNSNFFHSLLKTSLQPFGFMGVHIFPASVKTTFMSLKLHEVQPWPHIATLLRELIKPDGHVHIFKYIVTMQAKGGAKLFWTAGDTVRIGLAKIRVLMYTYRVSRQNFSFIHLLMLRELYSLPSISGLMAWKVYESASFNKEAWSECLTSYTWFGPFLPFILPHAFLMIVLRLIPHPVYSTFLRLVGKGNKLSNYKALKKKLAGFDGIKRGI